MRKNKRPVPSEPEQAAGNGLLDRRLFLTGGAAAIGRRTLPFRACKNVRLVVRAHS
jgi:hypothetical protein